MYHGSPHNLSKLSSGTRGLFLSPLKGIASIFIIDELKEFAKSQNPSFNTDYDEWRLSDSKLQKPLNFVHIKHNVPNVPKLSGTSIGYIYKVDVSKLKLSDFKNNPNPNREVIYSGPEIDYVSVEKITINWITEYSKEHENRHGRGNF
jgi:hypothetical protein